MSAEPTENAAPPKKGKLVTVLLLVFVALVAAAAGASAPFLAAGGSKGNSAKETEQEANAKPAFVTFGEVQVNLAEERMTRFIRGELILVADTVHEKQVSDAVTKSKAILKNWLISYLSDKSIRDVTGGAGVNRSRREIQDQFNSVLFPDGSEKIRDVLFEEYIVQ